VFPVVSLLGGPLTGMGFGEQVAGGARARIVALFDGHLRTAP
jgi:hypothetical protein